MVCEFEQLRTQCTADNLGKDSNNQQQQCEHQQADGQTAQVSFQTYTGKEYRGKQHISTDGNFLADIITDAGQVAEQKAGKICAGDICNTEKGFRAIGENEAECQAINGNTAVHLIVESLVQMLEVFVDHKAHNGNKHKEQDNFNQDSQNLDIRIGEAGYDRQGDDTQDIVDDSSTENGNTHLALQFSHLKQRFNCDAHRGSSQDNADKDSL